MNNNANILFKAINENQDLRNLSLSKDYTDFSLKDVTVNGLTVKEGVFKGAKLEKIVWSHCDFKNCVFDKNTIFEGNSFVYCTFDGCEFSQTSLKQNSWNNCVLNNVIFEKTLEQDFLYSETVFKKVDYFRCFLSSGKLEAVKLEETSILKTSFIEWKTEKVILEKVVFENSFFEKSDFRENRLFKCLFRTCSFTEVSWEKNEPSKTSMIRCKGVPQEVVREMVSKGGRSVPLYIRVLKNKLVLSLLVIFTSMLIYGGALVAFHPQFYFFRYFLYQIWMDPYHIHVDKEINVLLQISYFQREIIPSINKAVIAKKEEKLEESEAYFIECFKRLEKNKRRSKDVIFFLIREILNLNQKESHWKANLEVFETFVPEEHLQEMRLLLLEEMLLKYFPITFLQVLEIVLTNSGDDINDLVKVMNILGRMPHWYTEYKARAGQMFRSFLKRKAKLYPGHAVEYNYMREEVEGWLEDYANYLDPFKK